MNEYDRTYGMMPKSFVYLDIIILMTTTLWIHVSETKSPGVPTNLYPMKHTRQGLPPILSYVLPHGTTVR